MKEIENQNQNRYNTPCSKGGVQKQMPPFILSLMARIADVFSVTFQAIFAVLKFLVTPMKFLQKSDKQSARWLSSQEQNKFFHKSNAGFLVNSKTRLSLEDSFKNVVVFGNTGSGKTSALLKPALLNLEHFCSAVVLDVSGEIYQTTAPWLEHQGFTVKRLNLSDPESSDLFYNPINRPNRDIHTIIKTLIGSVYTSNGSDAFWNNGAASLIKICIEVLRQESEQRCTLKNLKKLLVQLSSEESLGYKYLLKYADEDLFQEFSSLYSEPKLFHSFKATAENALDFINDTALAKITEQDSLDFSTLRTEQTVWFITVKETHIKHCSVLINLFFAELFDTLMAFPNKYEQSVLLFIDEARLLNFDLPYYLALTRKYRIGSMLLYQSSSQLFSQFKTDAKTLLNGGIGSKIFLHGITDVHELQTLEQMIGYRIDEDGRKEALMPSNEIRTMKDELLLFSGALPPLKTQMHYYFRQRKWKRILKEFPPLSDINSQER